MGQIQDCVRPRKNNNNQKRQALPEQCFLPIELLLGRRLLGGGLRRVHGLGGFLPSILTPRPPSATKKRLFSNDYGGSPWRRQLPSHSAATDTPEVPSRWPSR